MNLDALDSQLLLFFNGMHNGYFDSFMSIATGRFIWIPLYLSLFLLLVRLKGLRTAAIWLVAVAVTIALADQICATVIRPLVARYRPANQLNPLSEFVHIVNGYRGGRYGFPSCHGANTFALVTIMSLIVRRRGFTLFMTAWALLNCYSRMYLGVHYPGDLIVGAAIGAVCGAAVYKAAQWFIQRYNFNGNGAGSFVIAGKSISPAAIVYLTGTVLVAIIALVSI